MDTEVVLWIVIDEVEVAGELPPQRLELVLSSPNRFPRQALQWWQLRVQRCLLTVTHLPAFPGEGPSVVAISISCCFAFSRNIMEVFLSSPLGKAMPGSEILAAR